ncbi:MAG: hypothetical protein ACJ8KF_00070 [Chthoniobacterales bacterium]|jgi:hypothetical protein
MTKRLRQRLSQCLAFGPLVIVCLGIACNGQILPQLVAQIVSLDLDHHVIVHVGSHGIDLVLTHDPPTAVSVSPQGTRRSIASESSEPAHVIHFPSGTSLANQTAVCERSTQQQIALHVPLAQPTFVDVFAPKVTLVYSRPPPDRTSNPFDRSTLLLI